MPIKIAINGFGRIGRAAFRAALETPGVEVVAINDLTDVKVYSHLLKYDTVYGIYKKEVLVEEGGIVVDAEGVTSSAEHFDTKKGNPDFLIIDGKKVHALAEKDPLKLPWKKLDIDVVLECTGVFTEYEKARAHLEAGAKKVIISAPSKGEGGQTLILGTGSMNSEVTSDVISNASCTTNCIAPVAQILEESFGIEKAWMTTVHSYTADQNLVDGPHKKDLRRARAAGANIIPTTSGATKAAAEAVPSLKHKFEGVAIRVATINVSVAIISAVLKKETTEEELNEVFKKATASEKYKGIVAVNEEPLVSSDFVGDSRSAVVDLELTKVIEGNLANVFAWYDNEWGYSKRLVELALKVGESIKSPERGVSESKSEVAPNEKKDTDKSSLKKKPQKFFLRK